MKTLLLAPVQALMDWLVDIYPSHTDQEMLDGIAIYEQRCDTWETLA